METFEHKLLGDQIRIETFDNHYFKNSHTLSFDKKNNLRLTPMRMCGGIPVPIKVEVSAGDIVALAGDYFTKAGWGNSLRIPPTVGDREAYQELLSLEVLESEKSAFLEAYQDLASNTLDQSLIDRIYNIENAFPGISQHAIYAAVIKNYSAKLDNNTAHFSPWSLRAYLVGHDNALRMAELAYHCKKIVELKENIFDSNIPIEVRAQLLSAIELIKDNPKYYKFETVLHDGVSEEDQVKFILTELSHRYHASAIAQDLFAMHFYSDHFAAGHSSRIGIMRKTLPQQFGVWGSILINTMHNEDNSFSVPVTNSLEISDAQADSFHMFKEKCKAYGDYTYLSRGNSETRDMLINGMDNSLGDISRLLIDGKKRDYRHFGGLSFLPTIDFSKRQLKPLFIQDTNNKIYVRSNIKIIDVLAPSDYQEAMKNPEAYGYEPLTYWKALLTVIKLRVLSLFYSATINPHFDENKMKEDELACAQKEMNSPLLQTRKIQNFELKHSNNKNTSVLITPYLEIEEITPHSENGKMELPDVTSMNQPISQPKLINESSSQEKVITEIAKPNWRNNLASTRKRMSDFFSPSRESVSEVENHFEKKFK